MSSQGQRLWIIGASSGIGYALAREAAQQGYDLILSARSTDKLQALQAEIGAQHMICPFDTTDRTAFAAAVDQVKTCGPIHSMIYLAAAYKPMPLLRLEPEAIDQIVDVNFRGALNFIHAVRGMIEQKQVKQIALCGSVAGFCGLPNGQPYSATKAAIINLAQSLHAELSPDVDVKLISPGFVRTPMTAKNSFAMPMMIEPKEAARAILEGLKKSAFEIHFPKRFTLLMKILAALPYPLYFFLTQKLKQAR